MNTLTNPQWRNVRLGDIGQSLIGLTYSPSNVKRSGTLVLRSSNIQDGELAFDDNVYVDCAIPEKIRTRENDILICVRNGSRRLIGKSAILDRRVSGQTFGAFMAVYRSDLNPFLRYFFQSDDFKRQIDEHLGATINQITNGSLNGFVVTLPSKSEQQAITERLQDVDRLIATLKRLISKKQAIKQGMMQELLTGNTRLRGFTGKWESKTIGQLCVSIRGGGTPSKAIADYWGGQIPWATVKDLSKFNPKGTLDHISTRGVAESAARVVPAGELIVSVRMLIARAVQFSVDVAINQDLKVLNLKQEVDPTFLRYWFNLNEESFARAAGGSTVSGISTTELASKIVDLPPIEEQAGIAHVLQDADEELNALMRRLQSARNVKDGMMQELLTGRTRLPIEEVSS
ncbi:restriction endonuclease subunit S [Corynebacterium casei]|uniref:Restriction endonuclease S subunit n=1 Tax=Corynebacterium casei LMG S-19264 TaxID=1285583 RepID=A0ABM5PQN3_9CORY|nr:restriction endonuclease subunit S [Corynebacterium casei]AHI20212.1 restriction endonuclease S subunit [Corynebacterium casei LMG S-19264]